MAIFGEELIQKVKHANTNAVYDPISFYLDKNEVCVMFHDKIDQLLLKNFARQIEFDSFKIPRKMVADLY